MANFRSNSRYTGGIITKNRSGKEFLILRRQLNLKEDEGDIFIIITEDLEKRADLVAHKAYGDSRLWWVVYEFNQIRDPFFDLKQGQILRLPKIERLLEAIQELEDK